MKKLYLILFLFFSLTQQSWALVEDSVLAEQFKVYFRLARTDVDATYLSNAQTLQQLRTFLKETSHAIDSITIVSYSSPEGPYWLNKRYAEQRGYSVYNYLQNNIEQQLSDSLVHLRFTAENWDGLRELVRNNYHRTDRAELLRLLQTRRIDDTHRKIEIQKLDNGNTWEYLLQHYMPQLRHATWIIVYYTTKSDKAESLQRIEPSVAQQDTIVVSVETEKKVEQPVEEQPIVQQPVVEETSITLPEAKETKWAVKTNLLYDAALMPTIEVEYYLTSRWSIGLEGGIAWWRNKEQHKYYHVAHLSPEVRYWFRHSDDFKKGHYVGSFLMGGLYDWQNYDGNKGEFAAAGISYGYMFPIARRLSLELGLGIGVLYTKYEEYLPEEGHYVYQQTAHTTYVGPVKGKISLVWHFDEVALNRAMRWLKGGNQ